MAHEAAEQCAQVLLAYDEVQKHNTAGDCWIIVHGQVYDLSTFDHPGGPASKLAFSVDSFDEDQNAHVPIVILKYAGADATNAFDEIHAPGIVKSLHENQKLGPIDPESVPISTELSTETANSAPAVLLDSNKPSLASLISVHDFEDVARKTYTAKAWAFYSSAATDLVSHQANLLCHRRLMLRPRVLKDVRRTVMKRQILGNDSSAPFFVSPTAMARLAHPEGELALARACGKEGIIQTASSEILRCCPEPIANDSQISSNASYPLAEIVAAGRPDQPFFLQLYVNTERHKTEALLREAKSLGNIKAVLVTVDAPVPGKREADERIAAENIVAAISGAAATNDKKGGGLGRVMAKYIDSSLSWKDLAWLKRVSGLPLVLKGVQTAADAVKAVEHGVDGILLSNHGGRSLDTTQPAMLTLLELHKACPEVFDKLEILVDGGFTRGTDILKAVALGATAVGIGRPWLYALNYGQEGVEQMSEILKDELTTAMKQSGITDVDEAHPGLVNTKLLEPLLQTSEAHPWIQWRPKARM